MQAAEYLTAVRADLAQRRPDITVEQPHPSTLALRRDGMLAILHAERYAGLDAVEHAATRPDDRGLIIGYARVFDRARVDAHLTALLGRLDQPALSAVA